MVIGVDEVGRGAYAGPLVVGAVALPPDSRHYIDSKQLSAAARERFAAQIADEAVYCGLGWVYPEEIDRVGLTRATRTAILAALRGAPVGAEILIDGTVNFLTGTPWSARCEKQADSRYAHVAAASIVAKFSRDTYMKTLAAKYPEYGFDRHVGYGVKEHQLALEQFGFTPHHRQSFGPVKLIEKCYEAQR